MLDVSSYSNSKTNINVNAVSGTLVKNYRKSFFVRFQLASNFGEQLLDINPTIYDKNYDGKWGSHDRPAVVIQCMCAGGHSGNEMIAEVMWKDDFDKLFETEEEE